MLSHGDEQYLTRHLSKNNVVLFTGAGFSCLAKNQRGQSLPLGSLLTTELLKLIDIHDPEDAGLQETFDAVLGSGIEHSVVRNLLEELLLVSELPAEYDVLTRVFWYRIYSTNIDDVITRVYKRMGDPRLDTLVFPSDDIRERDQSLKSIQAIYLNGRLPCRPSEVTFSVSQYGAAASRPKPLYDQFVRDYATRPVIFVGTALNEPLLWQCIEARQGKLPSTSEHRPKSFLVSPSIGEVKKAQLARYNVYPVKVDTAEFLEWLEKKSKELPSRTGVLRESNPNLWNLLQEESLERGNPEIAASFADAFTRVPLERPVKGHRSIYLLGAAPRWEDLFQELDAPRNITDTILALVGSLLESSDKIELVALLGSAGCGKSTILRRLGISLAQSGRLVFLTNSEHLPPPYVISDYLAAREERAVLLFDNAEVALGALPGLLEKLSALEKPAIIIVASRTNDFDRLWSRVDCVPEFHTFEVPHLERNEIESVLDVLDERNLLGVLQGVARNEQIRAFEQRASRQILVAMREATTGRYFDDIVSDEFHSLVPPESKVLYLCCALATDAGFRISRQQFVACGRLTPAETLHILARNLRDIVIPMGANDDLLLLRHRTIAEFMVEKGAPRPLLRDAYIRVLNSLSSEIRGHHPRSTVSRLYQALIRHDALYRRFHDDIDAARDIYEAVADRLKDDAQFWLQFGSLELEGKNGSLDFAENYLGQAEALDPSDHYVQNAKAHLLSKRSLAAASIEEAFELRRIATEILQSRLERSQFRDSYAVHILCTQRYHFARIWIKDEAEFHDEIGQLRELAERGSAMIPRHNRLNKLVRDLRRAEMQAAVKKEQREYPDLTDS